MRLRHFLLLSFFAFCFAPITLRAQSAPQHDIKCGTPLKRHHAKGHNPQFALPPNPHDSLFSPSRRFLIHFDAATSDTDSVTAPAYAQRAAEEADSAYAFEIGDLGYTAPEFSMNGHYDIYLKPVHLDPNNAYYGATYWLDNGELPNGPSGIARTRAYCIIDNSFKSNIYYTHGYDALRVTVFHEFFHVIQFSGYGQPDENGIFFQEMSSVWMEWLSSPHVHDYINYVGGYLHALDLTFQPLQVPQPIRIYGEYLFLAYLSERFDTSFVKEMWTNYRDVTSDPVTAMDLTLRKHGSSFCQEYERFGAEVIQTGRRFRGVSILPDAQVLPVDTIPLSRLRADSTMLFTTDALSLQFAASGNGADTCFAIIARDTNRALQDNGSIIFFAAGGDSLSLTTPEAYCDTEVCSSSILAADLAFPNPFVVTPTKPGLAYIQASTSAHPPVSTILDIFSINGTKIRHSEASAEPVRETWNATWDGRDDIGAMVESGEYLYTLKVDGALKVGKIVVVRK